MCWCHTLSPLSSELLADDVGVCLGAVSSGVVVPRSGRKLPVSWAHLCCNSSSDKPALLIQNISLSCSRTFMIRVRLEVGAIVG